MQTEYLYKKQQILFTETLPITRKTLKAISIRESDAILQSILDGVPHTIYLLSCPKCMQQKGHMLLEKWFSRMEK